MKSEIRNPKSERRPKAEDRSPRVFGLVAQIFNLPHRRFEICGESASPERSGKSGAQPTASRRYGRLKICATVRAPLFAAQSCTQPWSLDISHERIPTGFRRKARGCRRAATLGEERKNGQTPTGLRPIPTRRLSPFLVVVPEQSFRSRFRSQPRWGCGESRPFTQGSSFLATLGSATESRRDSGRAQSLVQSCIPSISVCSPKAGWLNRRATRSSDFDLPSEFGLRPSDFDNAHSGGTL